MDDATQLPKQELLIKLLKMSTSPNDGEALIAVRKANELLVSAGWDWEKLIRGKIIVVEDPFKNISEPPVTTRHAASYAPPVAPRTPPRPQAPPMTPRPPPPPPLFGTKANPLSTRPNLFAGHCHLCGIEVVAKAGNIFKSHNAIDWKIACNTCNISGATVQAHAAPRIRTPRKRSLADLA